jgi:hypothetical protein
VKRNLDTQAKITKEMRKVLSNRIDDNKARDVQISKMEGIIAGMEETVEELVDFKNINLTCRPMDPFQALVYMIYKYLEFVAIMFITYFTSFKGGTSLLVYNGSHIKCQLY